MLRNGIGKQCHYKTTQEASDMRLEMPLRTPDMRQRPLGKTGLTVSEIGFGGWAIGGRRWGGKRDEDSRQALRCAVDRGVNLFDTALTYGDDGDSEKLIGKLLREHRANSNATPLYVATKVPPKLHNYPAPPDAPLNDYYPRDWIVRCAEQSLKNLNIEQIDLLQLHVWADAWTDGDEWNQAMEDLRLAGKIRFVGMSLNPQDPNSALRLVRSGRVDVVQVVYNIFDQSPEDLLFSACLEHQVGVIARVPLNEGSLTGKMRFDTKFPESDFRSSFFAGDLLRQTVERVEEMRPILEVSAASMARGALRYCLSHPAVSTVIVGMRSQEQVHENTSASDDGPLLHETIDALRRFRWVRPPY
ncbi:MAG: aldo/keto reductase [Rhizonema sp. PD37]|nr:aldo/keto reductase [Rhizonema sp. PD37]